jgi:hypothetical protein
MDKLYIFGCSHSAVHNNKLLGISHMKKYYEYRGGNFPPTWSELLAKNLELELVNTAVWGLDNYRIFEIFCNTVEKIKSGDTVIIGWSSASRFSLYSEKYNTLHSVSIWSTSTKKEFINISKEFINISKQTIDEMLVNRDNPRWVEEVYSWTKVIEKLSKLIGFKVYFWSLFEEFQKLHIEHDLIKLGAEDIITETNGKAADHHFGEKGHTVQSHYIASMLRKKYKTLL